MEVNVLKYLKYRVRCRHTHTDIYSRSAVTCVDESCLYLFISLWAGRVSELHPGPGATDEWLFHRVRNECLSSALSHVQIRRKYRTLIRLLTHNLNAPTPPRNITFEHDCYVCTWNRVFISLPTWYRRVCFVNRRPGFIADVPRRIDCRRCDITTLDCYLLKLSSPCASVNSSAVALIH